MNLLPVARRFRFPDGTGVILGRDARENAILKEAGAVGALVYTVNCPGPTALVTGGASAEARSRAAALVAAWAKYDRLPSAVVTNVGEVAAPYDRAPFLPFQIL